MVADACHPSYLEAEGQSKQLGKALCQNKKGLGMQFSGKAPLSSILSSGNKRKKTRKPTSHCHVPTSTPQSILCPPACCVPWKVGPYRWHHWGPHRMDCEQVPQ